MKSLYSRDYRNQLGLQSVLKLEMAFYLFVVIKID